MASSPLVLAIGQFDGIHLGHQSVFRSALRAANDLGGRADVLTFHPHVADLLTPSSPPLLLATPEQNQSLIASCGIANVHSIPFTREFASMAPSDFLALLKLEFPSVAAIAVGQNFTFGKNRSGNAESLPSLAGQLGVAAIVVPHVEWNGLPISSTRIRTAVANGDLASARAMLGRPFSIAGMVVRGRAVGRTLGFPTANVLPSLPIRPLPGVYAARLLLDRAPIPGAAFVPDPSDPDQAIFGNVVEIHLPGVSRDLYGANVEISFTRRLRGRIPFPNQAFASAQLAKDVADALRADSEAYP